MGHFMDTARGHSGGPYWGWWGDEPWPRVVGDERVRRAQDHLAGQAFEEAVQERHVGVVPVDRQDREG